MWMPCVWVNGLPSYGTHTEQGADVILISASAQKPYRINNHLAPSVYSPARYVGVAMGATAIHTTTDRNNQEFCTFEYQMTLSSQH
jgi:hypothetical protein